MCASDLDARMTITFNQDIFNKDNVPWIVKEALSNALAIIVAYL